MVSDLNFMSATKLIAVVILLVTISACHRAMVMTPIPPNPKQGDVIQVRVGATKKDELSQLNYSINEVNGSGVNVTYDVAYDSCKGRGIYNIDLQLDGEAIYGDGEIKTYSQQYDLTSGDNGREDNDLDFAVYVGGGNKKERSVQIDMANKFIDSYDAYANSQYYWSENRFYNTQSMTFANGADLVVSFGHGSKYSYGPRYGGDVYLPDTEYGNFAPCGSSGDAEYLVFMNCNTLSLEDESTPMTYWEYWFNYPDSQLDNRPFTGLHMVLGFRTNFAVNSVHWGYWRTINGKKFVKQFANKLDGGWGVVDAWLDAASDELKQRNGKNMATVFYPQVYENDTVFSEKDDYIHANSNYVLKIVSFLE